MKKQLGHDSDHLSARSSRHDGGVHVRDDAMRIEAHINQHKFIRKEYQ